MLWAVVSLSAALAAQMALSYLNGRRVAQERLQERSEWFAERSELLNRIKPETAQVTQAANDTPMLDPIRTDEEYWEQRLMGQGEPETTGSPYGEQDNPWAEIS